MFFMGLGILVLVPAFKAVTGLPPFMGILLGLGVLWLVGDLVHRHKLDDDKEHYTLVRALTRIDMASIVFFIGICWPWPRARMPVCRGTVWMRPWAVWM
jgi:Na+/H+ antiporter NhaD/arsenite permease-like protein